MRTIGQLGPRLRRWRTVAALGAAVAALPIASTAVTGAAVRHQQEDPAVVRTDHGNVRGTVTETYREFQGIPYAAAPVGVRRWRSPEPAPAWSGIRDATTPKPGCAQLEGLPMDEASVTDDCLYLNVTTPRNSSGQRLPVVVWLHGGHFLFGQGDTYGGQRLAIGGEVVVVTLNYRLGPLGFLAHPALEGAQGVDTSGNYGLEDQQAALRWVRANAAAFGGDSGNVTIAGQSAGATSVCAHLSAPGSGGLFHRAIMQSNGCVLPFRTRQEARESSAAFVTAAGCDNDPAGVESCLRGRSARQLVEAAAYPGQTAWGAEPVAGGPVLPVDPAEAVATGRFHRVPVLIGATRDEYRAQVWGMERTGMLCAPGEEAPCPLTEDQYLGMVEATFAGDAATVLARYPRTRYGSATEALSAIMTDFEYARPIFDSALAFSRHVPTYMYEFADRDAPFYAEPATPSFPTGAYHTAELPYLFTVDYSHPLSAGQERLAQTMVASWSRFAHAGDPDGVGLPDWPRFDGRSPYVQALVPDAIGRTDFTVEHQVALWRSLPS
ncbi:carboxylesterase family protein [Micromonospora sp. NPDC050200]|uniref:carboxylesterase/lipase family protein n=1 Tax=Micromonospora sp. NPDC050200 TaxID=3155664 RepID=UPI003402934D